MNRIVISTNSFSYIIIKILHEKANEEKAAAFLISNENRRMNSKQNVIVSKFKIIQQRNWIQLPNFQ